MKKLKAVPDLEKLNSVKTGEKLSLHECKKILNRKGHNYTDEEIILIRDFVYAMATIDYLFFTEQCLLQQQILIQNNDEQNSNPLHQSEYRRAS